MCSQANKTSQIKAIVFDLDDTLYPQIEYKRSGFHHVADWVARHYPLDRRGIWAALEEILHQYGPSYPKMFDRLADRIHLEPNDIARMIAVFIQHPPRIQCYPGVMEMLRRLRHCYALGLLTDGGYQVQRKKIEALDLGARFDAILCSDRLGLEKPAAELFLWFEEKYKLNGWNMLYIGDNPLKDFYGANLRGWHTIRVKTGEHANEKSPTATFKAQYTLNAVTDVENLLKPLCEPSN